MWLCQKESPPPPFPSTETCVTSMKVWNKNLIHTLSEVNSSVEDFGNFAATYKKHA